MSTEANIDTVVKTLIQTEIIKALNNAPEAIDKLVKAALAKPVDYAGRDDSYGPKMPYLEYLVGSAIRNAATTAVHKVVGEHAAEIESYVREGLKADSIVSAMTKAIMRATESDYKIHVSFEKEKDR